MAMEEHARQALADVGREFYTRGWMLATAGNLSCRLGDDRYTITASGGHKGRLTTADFINFKLGMQSEEPHRRSSAETVVHDELYARLGDRAGAILHVHAPWLTLVSRLHAGAGEVRFEAWEYIKALGFWGEGDVAVVPIVPNHADLHRLGVAVRDAARATPAVLVNGHGVYAWGTSIADAQRHIEATEFLCQLEWETQRMRTRGSVH
jgi:methylthioribulose-1-phosphate dehydratase